MGSFQARAADRRPRRFRRGHARVLTAVALLAGAVVGCSRRGLPGTVPVDGTVTFDGGGCPGVGCVYFLPSVGDSTAGTQLRPGWARFERDGRYRVTTLVTNDGLLPGTYTVRVECHAVNTGGRRGHEEGASLVPEGLVLPQIVVPSAGRGPMRHDIDVVARPGGASGYSSAGG